MSRQITTPFTYSLPSGTAAVSGQPISSTAYNNFITDVAATFNAVWPITLGGTGTTDGSVRAPNGTAAAPSVSFSSDTNIGMYRIAADNIGIAVNGTKIVDIGVAGVTVTGTLGVTGVFTSAGFTATSTDAGATGGPDFEDYRNSASPAASDILGRSLHTGQNSTPAKVQYAHEQTVIISPTAAAEFASRDQYVMVNGTEVLGLSNNGTFLSANNHVNGYATTATAAGTTTLTIASKQQQYFTGVTTQTVVLPVVSTGGMVLGHTFRVVNNSTGAVTVQSSGANAIAVLPAGTTATFTCILTSGTTAASWDAKFAGTVATPGLVLLTSGTVSAAATLDIVLTAYTAYSGLLIKLYNFVPVSAASLYLRVSTNGGVSYDAGASDYSYSFGYWNSNSSTWSAGGNSTGATQIILMSNLSNTASDGLSADINIPAQTATGLKPKMIASGNQFTAADSLYFFGGGNRNANQDTDAVRFLMSTGNIASGSYAVYGYA